MANVILLKRNSTQSAVPTTGQLQLGELAINTYDGKVYLKKNDGSDAIVLIGADADTLDTQDGTYYLDYNNFTNIPTIDAVPTDVSTNAVQSDGVFDALATKEDSLGFTPENVANKGVANGYPSLGADIKIPTAYLPALAITDTSVVASELLMLALTAETGDVAVRSDLNKTYILAGTDPSVLGDWQEMLTPTDAVISVNGETGAVTLTTSDITEGTNLYYTDARVLTYVGATKNDVGTTTGDLWSANKIIDYVESEASVRTTLDPTTNDDTSAGNYIGQLWVNTTTDEAFVCLDDTNTVAVWFSVTATASGTVTGASNVGTAGVGVYKDEVTGVLRFKKLNTATNGNITITDDTGNDEIDLSVDITDGGTTATDLWSADKIQTVVDARLPLVLNIKDNITAVLDPATTDDTSGNYSVGSIWVNVSNDTAFVCVDATASSAIWLNVTLQGDITSGADTSTAGVGIYEGKTGSTLNFKGIKTGSTKVTVTDSAGDHTVAVDVDETNINHNNLLNYDIAEHRTINDAGVADTDLWSADKIETRTINGGTY